MSENNTDLSFEITAKNGEDSFIYELPEPGDYDSFFAFGLAKSGSTLLNALLDDVCAAASFPKVDIPNQAFGGGIMTDDLSESIDNLIFPRGYAYLGWRHFPVYTNFDYTKVKNILLVRDPRDMVISYYFSLAYSHQIPEKGAARDAMMDMRNKVQATAVNDWIREPKAWKQPIANVNGFLAKLPSETLRIYRYEDVIFRKKEWLLDMLAYLDITLEEEVLNEIIQRHDIVPTQENKNVHIRQVRPGNYKKHLDEKAIGFLNKKLKGYLSLLGYDRPIPENSPICFAEPGEKSEFIVKGWAEHYPISFLYPNQAEKKNEGEKGKTDGADAAKESAAVKDSAAVSKEKESKSPSVFTIKTVNNDKSFKYELAEPADCKSFFVFGLEKSGSTLLNKMITKLCYNAKVPINNIPSASFEEGIVPGHLSTSIDQLFFERGYGNLGWRHFPVHTKFDFTKVNNILLVRDPRDILISYYFSAAFSHVIPEKGDVREKLLDTRSKVQAQAVAEWVRDPDIFLKPLRNLHSFISKLPSSSLRIYRYEDVIFRKREWTDDMLRYLGIEIAPDAVDNIVKQHDVIPDQENKDEHIRQVKPGNYKKHFDEETIGFLDEQLGGYISLLGYDKDIPEDSPICYAEPGKESDRVVKGWKESYPKGPSAVEKPKATAGTTKPAGTVYTIRSINKEQSFDYELPAPGGCDSFFAFGLAKSGSTLLNNMLAEICKLSGIPAVVIPNNSFRGGINPSNLSKSVDQLFHPKGYGYLAWRRFPEYTNFDFSKVKNILLVRDPRDMLVSLYFSLAYSHRVPDKGATRAAMLNSRNKIQSTEISEWVRNPIKCKQPAINMDGFMSKIPSSALRIYRYEDVIFRKNEWVKDMLTYLDINVDPVAVDEIIKKYDIVPDRENKDEHIRQVKPGNYKKHFDEETIGFLDEQLAGYISLMGYDKDIPEDSPICYAKPGEESDIVVRGWADFYPKGSLESSDAADKNAPAKPVEEKPAPAPEKVEARAVDTAEGGASGSVFTIKSINKKQSFKYEMPEPANSDSFFAFGLAKSGSTLLNNMLADVCNIAEIPAVNIASTSFKNGIVPGSLTASVDQLFHPRGYGYLAWRNFPVRTNFDFSTVKNILLVRDPRDMLISHYFSLAYSHQIPKDGDSRDFMLDKRNRAQASGASEWVRDPKAWKQPIANMNGFLANLPASSLRIYRYEDVIFRKREWLEDMLRYIGIEIKPETVDEIIMRHDIVPSEEKKEEHIRQVKPGNYKKHFDEETIGFLNKELGGYLTLMGYDKDIPENSAICYAQPGAQSAKVLTGWKEFYPQESLAPAANNNKQPAKPAPKKADRVGKAGSFNIKSATSNDSFKYEIADPADCDSFFVFGLEKSGSTLLTRMMLAFCSAANIPTTNIPSKSVEEGIIPGHLSDSVDQLFFNKGYGNLGWRHFPVHTKFDYSKVKNILLVRDPRDILISYYFSAAYSHVIPEKGEARDIKLNARNKMLELQAGEWVRDPEVFKRPINNLHGFMKKIPSSSLRIYRYEDVIFRKREWAEDMLNYLGINVKKGALERIISKHDVVPEEEDKDQHIRQVKPGNYKKHFDQETVEFLNEELSGYINLLGYDKEIPENSPICYAKPGAQSERVVKGWSDSYSVQSGQVVANKPATVGSEIKNELEKAGAKVVANKIGDTPLNMKIAFVHNWPGAKNSELDLMQRLKDLAAKRNVECINISPYGDLLSDYGEHIDGHGVIDFNEISFLIYFHYTSANYNDTFSYMFNWNPFQYVVKNPVTNEVLHEKHLAFLSACFQSHDFLLSAGSDEMDDFARALDAFDGSNVDSVAGPMHTTCNLFDQYDFTDLKDFKVFYIAANWERLLNIKRHGSLLEMLGASGHFDLYGLREQHGVYLWAGIENYKGELPFDGGRSIIKETNRCGVTLVLHSNAHRESAVVSTRIFQALAAKSVIITDDNPWIIKNFGDTVLSFPYKYGDDVWNYGHIIKLVEWIKEHPEEAIEKAKRAYDIFLEKYSLDYEFNKLLDMHSERVQMFEDKFCAKDPETVVDVVYSYLPHTIERFIADMNKQKLVKTVAYIAASEEARPGVEAHLRNVKTDFEWKFISDKLRVGEVVYKQIFDTSTNYFIYYHSDISWKKYHLTMLVRKLEDGADIAQCGEYIHNSLMNGVKHGEYFTSAIAAVNGFSEAIRLYDMYNYRVDQYSPSAFMFKKEFFRNDGDRVHAVKFFDQGFYMCLAGIMYVANRSLPVFLSRFNVSFIRRDDGWGRSNYFSNPNMTADLEKTIFYIQFKNSILYREDDFTLADPAFIHKLQTVVEAGGVVVEPEPEAVDEQAEQEEELKQVIISEKAADKKNISKRKHIKTYMLLKKSKLFFRKYYLDNNPDLAEWDGDLLWHYILHGAYEGRDPNPLFSSNYYLENYEDVALKNVNPLMHYIRHGAKEGRNPSENFNTKYYLEKYPDVESSGLNPLFHYLNHGLMEGRLTRPK